MEIDIVELVVNKPMIVTIADALSGDVRLPGLH